MHSIEQLTRELISMKGRSQYIPTAKAALGLIGKAVSMAYECQWAIGCQGAMGWPWAD